MSLKPLSSSLTFCLFQRAFFFLFFYNVPHRKLGPPKQRWQRATLRSEGTKGSRGVPHERPPHFSDHNNTLPGNGLIRQKTDFKANRWSVIFEKLIETKADRLISNFKKQPWSIFYYYSLFPLSETSEKYVI